MINNHCITLNISSCNVTVAAAGLLQNNYQRSAPLAVLRSEALTIQYMYSTWIGNKEVHPIRPVTRIFMLGRRSLPCTLGGVRVRWREASPNELRQGSGGADPSEVQGRSPWWGAKPPGIFLRKLGIFGAFSCHLCLSQEN